MPAGWLYHVERDTYLAPCRRCGAYIEVHSISMELARHDPHAFTRVLAKLAREHRCTRRISTGAVKICTQAHPGGQAIKP